MWGNNAGALRLRAGRTVVLAGARALRGLRVGRTVVLAPREHALPRVTGLRQRERARALCAPCDSCAFRLRAKRLLLCGCVLAGARALRGLRAGRTVVLAPREHALPRTECFAYEAEHVGRSRSAKRSRPHCEKRVCSRGREHYGVLMSTAGLFFDIIRTICHGGR